MHRLIGLIILNLTSALECYLGSEPPISLLKPRACMALRQFGFLLIDWRNYSSSLKFRSTSVFQRRVWKPSQHQSELIPQIEWCFLSKQSWSNSFHSWVEYSLQGRGWFRPFWNNWRCCLRDAARLSGFIGALWRKDSGKKLCRFFFAHFILPGGLSLS